MRRTAALRPTLSGLIILLLLTTATGIAEAAFPLTPPNDPRYPAAVCPPASSCAGPTGQWNLFSVDAHFPPTTRPSGISADLAWQVTTGRPDTIIAILDSGVQYDHEDLRNKIWLNCGELPAPQHADGSTAPGSSPGCRDVTATYDLNGDGVFNVRDYSADPRVSDSNGSGALDRGDLRIFLNGVDDDGNGYVDDLSGWDADDDDGDEYDHRYFGHGTGRAGIAAPETDNGVGVAGVCPDCPLMNVRIDDTFVCNSENVAKGAIYAADNGARVISMSLGCTTASRLSRGAFAYAIAKNVLPVNASANEFSFHQNFQAVFDDVMTIGAVTPNSRTLTTTWLQKANFAIYGAHLDVVAPTDMPGASMGRSGAEPDNTRYSDTQSGTSSSTPHVAGVAALVFARGHDLIDANALPVGPLALKDISALEVRQIIDRTADDVTPADGTSYAVSVGWDKYTGYGRVNAKAAVDRVTATTIPPEADIKSPDWYALVDGTVPVEFYANARWASTFAYTLEVGAGVEPTSFTPLATQSGLASNPALSSANRVRNFSASFATAALADGLYTLRLRVTDNLGNLGEDRMAVWVRHPDPQDQPGFPKTFDGSLESLSIALADLNGDNRLEIIFSDGNGEVHAVEDDGTELVGFPVHTALPRNLPLTMSDAFDGNAANGEVPLAYSPIIGGVAVGDLYRDGGQEIVVGASDGQVYCWRADGSQCGGFPVSTDHGFSRDQYAPHAQVLNASRGESIGAVPALGDLDGDGTLEIVVGSADQKLYVWHPDGARMPPFPLQVFDPSSAAGVDGIAPKAIISSAAIADVDNDGALDIVVGTTESYATPAPAPPPAPGGSGRAYLIHADGTIASGWPVKPTSVSPSAVPLVAEGVGTSPALADVDSNGTKEVALTAFLGDATLYRADGTTFSTMSGAFGATGPGSDLDETTHEGGLARGSDQPGHFYVGEGAFADLTGAGALSYTAPTVGNGILAIAAGSGTPAVFDHLLSVWNATTGTQAPAFPRVIEDWQFFTGPTVADLTGDGLPEILATSGGYFVHGFNSAGVEPAGWPKLTGHWQTATPSVGDVDGDGSVEVVQTTRLGALFVWKTAGAACQPDQWRKFRHDEWNTGTYGADTRRPAHIDDLQLSGAAPNVTLQWTAPGDDGRCGTAAAYELRAAATPITVASFASATPITLAPPASGGSAESRMITPPAGALFYALRAVDEVGNVGPLTSAGTFELKRLRITRVGAGSDRMTLNGRVQALLAQLGLPGQDLTITLADAGGAFFAATVPASALTPTGNGTKLRFRDSTGTIANGITSLRIGGKKRTDVAIRARGLDLGGAASGPFRVTLTVGSLELSASGVLRSAGSKLVAP